MAPCLYFYCSIWLQQFFYWNLVKPSGSSGKLLPESWPTPGKLILNPSFGSTCRSMKSFWSDVIQLDSSGSSEPADSLLPEPKKGEAAFSFCSKLAENLRCWGTVCSFKSGLKKWLFPLALVQKIWPISRKICLFYAFNNIFFFFGTVLCFILVLYFEKNPKVLSGPASWSQPKPD